MVHSSLDNFRLYSVLAEWWPLLSPPEHYGEEAADLLARLQRHAQRPINTLTTALELGSGGGSLAFHLKSHFAMTLTDIAPRMLDVSRQVNPECEHVVADMRTLRLGRRFDFVLIHDAVMYMTTRADLAAALSTAAAHAAPGAVVALLPDAVAETFETETAHDGLDAPDGRGLRYLEWRWDPDPTDETFEIAYSVLVREADGRVRAEHEVHHEGLFARQTWVDLIGAAGFTDVAVETDPWERVVFFARKAP